MIIMTCINCGEPVAPPFAVCEYCWNAAMREYRDSIDAMESEDGS